MPNEWHTPLEVPGNRLPETGSRRKLLNVRGKKYGCKNWKSNRRGRDKIEPTLVICRELIDLGRTQRQQDLKEGSCTEATPSEKT
ncbi:hypothetical protein V6N13_043489 [Hibiscus sabdariffa]